MSGVNRLILSEAQDDNTDARGALDQYNKGVKDGNTEAARITKEDCSE